MICGYFDDTMVMGEEGKIRKNGLGEMKKVCDLIGRFGMMNEIEVK